MRLHLAFLFLLLMVPAISFGADSLHSLTLSEAIQMAITKNLDVRAELYNPAQYEADINKYRAIYDPVLDLQANYTDSKAAFAATPGEILLLNSSISKLFWTGGTATASFNNSDVINSSNSWQSGLGVSLKQPLLKNVGREATELLINISRTSKFASLERFNTLLLSTVARVRTEYFKLYSLREDKEVKKVSLDLARKILYETQARVKAGVMPAMEVLNAEYGAVIREKDLLDAERAVVDQMDVLRTLLQMEPEQKELLTADTPSRELIDTTESAAIQKALNRSDIREQKRNIELAELQTRNYRQSIRPDLSLAASMQMTGVDQSYSRNMEKLITNDYPVWSVGLNLTYPLGNGAAESDYRKSRLKAEQLSFQLRSLEDSAANSVRSAIRGVVTGHKQIEVADRGRAFAEERLKAFSRKQEVGLATTKDVLDVENDLAVAKSNQIKAVVGYANALTAYWQATGELLDKEGIRVVESDADKLYSAAK